MFTDERSGDPYLDHFYAWVITNNSTDKIIRASGDARKPAGNQSTCYRFGNRNCLIFFFKQIGDLLNGNLSNGRKDFGKKIL
jgi:hypothetical protein